MHDKKHIAEFARFLRRNGAELVAYREYDDGSIEFDIVSSTKPPAELYKEFFKHEAAS